MYFDLAGGNRIPKIGERQARSVAELRAAGVGVSRVLLVHDGTPESSDLFKAVLTMLDPQVALDDRARGGGRRVGLDSTRRRSGPTTQTQRTRCVLPAGDTGRPSCSSSRSRGTIW